MWAYRVFCCFLLSGLFFRSVGMWAQLSPVVSSAIIMTLSDALCYHHHIVPWQCSSSQLVSVLLGVFTFLFLLTLCQLQDDFMFLPCWKGDQLFLLSWITFFKPWLCMKYIIKICMTIISVHQFSFNHVTQSGLTLTQRMKMKEEEKGQ